MRANSTRILALPKPESESDSRTLAASHPYFVEYVDLLLTDVRASFSSRSKRKKHNKNPDGRRRSSFRCRERARVSSGGRRRVVARVVLPSVQVRGSARCLAPHGRWRVARRVPIPRGRAEKNPARRRGRRRRRLWVRSARRLRARHARRRCGQIRSRARVSRRDISTHVNDFFLYAYALFHVIYRRVPRRPRGSPLVVYSNSASSSPGSSRSSSSEAMASSWSWIMSFVIDPRTVFWPMGWTSARALRMRAR